MKKDIYQVFFEQKAHNKLTNSKDSINHLSEEKKKKLSHFLQKEETNAHHTKSKYQPFSATNQKHTLSLDTYFILGFTFPISHCPNLFRNVIEVFWIIDFETCFLPMLRWRMSFSLTIQTQS